LFNFRGRFRMTKSDFHRGTFFGGSQRIIMYEIYIERGLVDDDDDRRGRQQQQRVCASAISLYSTHVFACDKEQVEGIFESVERRRGKVGQAGEKEKSVSGFVSITHSQWDCVCSLIWVDVNALI
jgi:hypothetical protein